MQDNSTGKNEATYTSIHSNSSRLRCLLRKAAARFLTSRASRLLRPETSGGMKSLLEMRSPIARFLVAEGAGLAERLLPTEEVSEAASSAWWAASSAASDGDRDGGVGGCSTSAGKSKSWWVGRQASEAVSCILSILLACTGERELSERGGDGGRL